MANKSTILYPTEKSIGGIVIDAFISENYSFPNEATEIPLENGVTITDHVFNKPDEIKIEGFVGVFEFEENVTANDAQLEYLNKAKPDRKERVRFYYNELLRLRNERQPITLVTGLDTYSDMIIMTLDIPRDVETGADLNFTMTLKKLPIIQSETVAINVAEKAPKQAQDQTASASETGVNPKNEKGAETSEYRKWIDGAFGRGEISQADYSALISSGV